MAGARAQRVNAGLLKNRAADFLLQGAMAEARGIENLFAGVSGGIRARKDRKERERARAQQETLARDRMAEQKRQFDATNTRLTDQFAAREKRMREQFDESQTGTQTRFEAEQGRLKENAKQAALYRERQIQHGLAKDLYATQVQASKLEHDARQIEAIRARVAGAKNMNPEAKMGLISELNEKLKSMRGALIGARAKAGGADNSDYRSAAVLAALAEKRVDEEEATLADMLKMNKKRPGAFSKAEISVARDNVFKAIASATEGKVHAGSLLKQETIKRAEAQKAKDKQEAIRKRRVHSQNVWSFAARAMPKKVVFDSDGNLDGTKSDEETLRKIAQISLEVRNGKPIDHANREIREMSQGEGGPSARREIKDAQAMAKDAIPKPTPGPRGDLVPPTNKHKMAAAKSAYDGWYAQYGSTTDEKTRNEALAEIMRITGADPSAEQDE